MKIHESDTAIVFLHEIERAGGSCRDDERRAVEALMLEAFPGGDTRLAHLPSGAPLLEGPAMIATARGTSARVSSVSVSHADRYAVLALGLRGKVGVDVERLREQLSRVAGKFLTPKEAMAYCTPELLLRAWTATEAVYKAAGVSGLPLCEGIRLPDPSFAHPAEAAGFRFRLSAIDAPEGYAITLAICVDEC